MAQVSWMWGGKRHYGTKIRETKTHIFARTKNGKIKKAICSFIFVFFPMVKFFSCRSKIFQNGSVGTENGPSDSKISRFTPNVKIGSSGPFLVPHEPF